MAEARNITLTLDDETLREARVLAGQRGLCGHALFATVSWGFGAADADAALTGAGPAR
jgi:hypothetical protein